LGRNYRREQQKDIDTLGLVASTREANQYAKETYLSDWQ